MPNSVVEQNDKEIVVLNFQGELFRYPLPQEDKQGKKTSSTDDPVSNEGGNFPLCTASI